MPPAPAPPSPASRMQNMGKVQHYPKWIGIGSVVALMLPIVGLVLSFFDGKAGPLIGIIGFILIAFFGCLASIAQKGGRP